MRATSPVRNPQPFPGQEKYPARGASPWVESQSEGSDARTVVTNLLVTLAEIENTES